MKWLKLKEEALPKSIRFSILAFDIDKASGKGTVVSWELTSSIWETEMPRASRLGSSIGL